MGGVVRGALAGVLVAVLAGCSSAAPPRPPAVMERAAAADSQARQAMRAGELALARNLFEQSLRLHQSLDDLPGVATASINLAAVYHGMKDDAMALRLLDAIVGDKLVPYPPELRSAAAFRKAVILVDQGAPGSTAAIETAAALCGKSCEFAAGLDNLRARVALQGRQYAQALTFAKAAENGAGADKQELANAWRNAAAAEAGAGNHASALDRYRAALALDKPLGVPQRIADDLEGVSRELKQLGRADASASYARRAAAAREAPGAPR